MYVNFDEKYLEIPKEIIISTLQGHQRYFPLFDNKEKLTNFFLLVSNKIDNKNLIKEGNKRVVEARLSDAKFFWDKDKSRNLIKASQFDYAVSSLIKANDFTDNFNDLTFAI